MIKDEEIQNLPLPGFNGYTFYKTTKGHYRVEGEAGNVMEVDMESNPIRLYDASTREFMVFVDSSLESGIQAAFEIYKMRPEYYVDTFGKDSYSSDMESMQNAYEKLLVGISFIRCVRNHSDVGLVYPKIKKCLDWLRTTDFYTCPASTIYHDAVPGGLVSHSLRVVCRILDLIKTDAFSNSVKIEDAILVALVHDWCKIGLYDSYNKNVKNENTGKWEQVAAYRYKDNPMTILGHGVSSMFLAQKFFRISTEEALAIRWHMGWTRVVDSEMNELQHANEMYPLVHLLQFADQLAIVNY